MAGSSLEITGLVILDGWDSRVNTGSVSWIGGWVTCWVDLSSWVSWVGDWWTVSAVSQWCSDDTSSISAEKLSLFSFGGNCSEDGGEDGENNDQLKDSRFKIHWNWAPLWRFPYCLEHFELVFVSDSGDTFKKFEDWMMNWRSLVVLLYRFSTNRLGGWWWWI